MKLPVWEWKEARKQFELRLPGLLNSRRIIDEQLRKAGHAWHERDTS